MRPAGIGGGVFDVDQVAARVGKELTEAMAGIWDWRAQHPKATLREIEVELDARFDRARARVLEEVAQLSRAADLSGERPEARSRCPDCGATLRPLGKRRRRVVTTGGEEIHLERDYARCTGCGRALFPPR